MNEEFAADAAAANASYPGGGTSPLSAGAVSLKVSYDADSRSYTITEGSRNQQFRPADIQPGTDPRGRTYVRADGAITDTLALSQPGDSGNWTYRYAGTGLWRRTESAGGANNSRFTAFSYGMVTPDAAVPRSGNASFSVLVNGQYATDQNLSDFDGAGLLRADFATGDWTLSGVARQRMASVESSEYQSISYTGLSGSGRVASGAAILLGSIEIGSNPSYSGVVKGALYGPAVEEVAGSFYLLASSGSRQGAGTLIGRQGSTAPVLETLSAMLAPTSLQYYSAELRYTANSDGTFRGVALTPYLQSGMGYKSDPRTYDVGGNIVYDADKRIAAESDARFTTYRVDVPGAGGVTRTFTTYNPGSGNSELELSYLSFAQERFVASDGGRIENWRVFGIQADREALVPRSGTGAYRGVVYGSAIGAGNTADRFTLTGTVGIDVDFALQSSTGSMVLGVTNARTSAVSDLGTFSFSQLSFPYKDGNGNALRADITGAPGTIGSLYARFYGPAAEELGGHFSLITPGVGTVLTGAGVLVAKRP